MKNTLELGKMIEQINDLVSNSQHNSQQPLQPHVIKMPQLALVMANYFNSLSKYCISIYNGYAQKEQPLDKKNGRKRIKTQKKGIHPPKKPMTAYILYYQQKVPTFQEKYPNYTISELTRLIAKQWSGLPEEVKKPYTQKAAEDRKRYETEKKEYRAEGLAQREKQKQQSQENSKQPEAESSSSSSSPSSGSRKESESDSDSYESRQDEPQ